MVSVKEAVEKAVEFAQTVLDPPRTADLRLEEVESSKGIGTDAWLITLSMPKPHNGMDALLGRGQRQYKTFSVARDTGEVLAMKIRELAGAE